MQDPGFNNPELVGQTICWGDRVSRSYCDEREGVSGSLDEYENGAEAFCAEQGSPADCGGGLFMPSEGACPESSADTAEG